MTKFSFGQNPQRKLKQGMIYSKTNQTGEAYKLYEELLFSGYQMLSVTLNSLYLLSIDDKNFVKAHLFTDKQLALANIFEMGKYHEVACKLDLATAEQDVDTVLNTMEEMLHSLNELTSFSSSSLYEHMDFTKKTNDTFSKQLKQELLHLFQDKETYAFLKDNERWQKLISL